MAFLYTQQHLSLFQFFFEFYFYHRIYIYNRMKYVLLMNLIYLFQFFCFFFSIRVFFHRHWRLTGQQGKGGDHFLFHSTTSTRSRTFRHLFVTLHVTWLSRIFNRIACIYQTATWWDLLPYRITIWLIDDVTISLCLFTWRFDSSFFCYSNLRQETGGYELASTITLALQANRLTKCASSTEHILLSDRSSKELQVSLHLSM